MLFYKKWVNISVILFKRYFTERRYENYAFFFQFSDLKNTLPDDSRYENLSPGTKADNSSNPWLTHIIGLLRQVAESLAIGKLYKQWIFNYAIF